jgi:thioredoxin reductase
MNQYDVVVIGGGAAGLSGALVLSRPRRTVLVVDAGSPRNAPAADLHGYLSRDGTAPAELLAARAGAAAAIGINADLVDEDVRNAVRDLDNAFAVTAIPNTHQESA